MTFSTSFKNELLNLLEKKIKITCKSEEIQYSKGQYKIMFDGYIEKDNQLIIIEIEFRRSDPINNLIKTLHWVCHSVKSKKIKMIQIYDNNYYSQPENKYKKEFTIFLAKRCNLLHKKLANFVYKPVDIVIDQKAFKKNDLKEAKKLARKCCECLLKLI